MRGGLAFFAVSPALAFLQVRPPPRAPPPNDRRLAPRAGGVPLSSSPSTKERGATTSLEPLSSSTTSSQRGEEKKPRTKRKASSKGEEEEDDSPFSLEEKSAWDDDWHDDTFRWYILNVVSGGEKTIAEKFRHEATVDPWMGEQIEEVVVPYEKVVGVRGKKIGTRSKIVYPGYIFVRIKLNKPVWELMSKAPRVKNFIGFDPGQRNGIGMVKPGFRGDVQPLPLSEKEAQTMLAVVEREKKDVTTETVFGWDVQLGRGVAIIDGQHAGERGVVKSVKNQELVVNLRPLEGKRRELLVAFPPKDLRPLSAEEQQDFLEDTRTKAPTTKTPTRGSWGGDPIFEDPASSSSRSWGAPSSSSRSVLDDARDPAVALADRRKRKRKLKIEREKNEIDLTRSDAYATRRPSRWEAKAAMEYSNNKEDDELIASLLAEESKVAPKEEFAFLDAFLDDDGDLVVPEVLGGSTRLLREKKPPSGDMDMATMTTEEEDEELMKLLGLDDVPPPPFGALAGGKEEDKAELSTTTSSSLILDDDLFAAAAAASPDLYDTNEGDSEDFGLDTSETSIEEDLFDDTAEDDGYEEKKKVRRRDEPSADFKDAFDADLGVAATATEAAAGPDAVVDEETSSKDPPQEAAEQEAKTPEEEADIIKEDFDEAAFLRELGLTDDDDDDAAPLDIFAPEPEPEETEQADDDPGVVVVDDAIRDPVSDVGPTTPALDDADPPTPLQKAARPRGGPLKTETVVDDLPAKSDEDNNPVVDDDLPAAEKTPRPAADSPYHRMKMNQLKEILKAKGLRVGGKKAELIDRLIEADEG